MGLVLYQRLSDIQEIVVDFAQAVLSTNEYKFGKFAAVISGGILALRASFGEPSMSEEKRREHFMQYLARLKQKELVEFQSKKERRP